MPGAHSAELATGLDVNAQAKRIRLPDRHALQKPAAVPSLVSTIFHESWWMDIACKGANREAVVSSGGAVVGRLPYLVSTRLPGVTSLRMPSLAHVLGPALAPELLGPGFPRSLKQIAVTSELIAQLPRASHVSFRLHGGLSNTLAFDAAGYSSHIDYTVEVKPDTPEHLWRQMRDKTRNVIRRAQEKLSVGEAIEPLAFMAFYERNLRKRGLRNSYDNETCTTLMAECIRREKGRFLVATDAEGRMEAAIFTVWDDRSEYYFMSSRTQDSMNGAISLLIWKAIQHAARRSLVFDMDCVHICDGGYPNLLLLTGFGGELKPRYLVRRTGAVIRLAQDLRHLLRRQ